MNLHVANERRFHGSKQGSEQRKKTRMQNATRNVTYVSSNFKEIETDFPMAVGVKLQSFMSAIMFN